MNRSVKLLSSEGTQHEASLDILQQEFEFFNPSVFSLGKKVQTPFSTEQLTTFVLYFKRDPSPVGRVVFEYSTLFPVVDYFRPKEGSTWWSGCVVDEGVQSRFEALHNLGLYVRGRGMLPPYVYLRREPAILNGGFGLAWDPVWDTQDWGAIEGSYIASERWIKGTRTDEVISQAFEIEWVNVLYGILESAWLRKASNLPRNSAWKHDTEKNPSNAYAVPLDAKNINWKDVATFIPTVATMTGLAPRVLSSQESASDAVFRLQYYENSLDGPISSAVAALSDDSSRGIIPFYHTMVRYNTFKEHLYVTEFKDSFKFLYERILAWNQQRTTRDNVVEVVRLMGLSPLVKGGKRLDINLTLRDVDYGALYRKLVEEGLEPIGTEENWKDILDMPQIEVNMPRRYDNPLFNPANSSRRTWKTRDSPQPGDMILLSSSTVNSGIKDTALTGLASRISALYYNQPVMFELEDLSRNVLNRGYFGIFPDRYTKASSWHNINLLDLPAIVHTHTEFYYPGSKGFQSVKPADFDKVAKYMSETIGGKNMALIADILLTYIEVKPDRQALNFVVAMEPYISANPEQGFFEHEETREGNYVM